MNNTTEPSVPVDTSGLFIWAAVFGGISVAVVTGNSIIIAAFCLNKKLLHTRTNYFLVSLAVADLLVGSFSIPMYVYDIFAYLQQTSYSLRLNDIYTAIDIFTSFASIFALVLVALERAFSVTYPHKHRLVNCRVYFFLIGCVWVIASWLGALKFFSSYKRNQVLKDIFSYLMMSFIFISLLLLIAAYTTIWRRVKAPIHSLHKSRSLHESRLAKTLIIVTCVFFCSWLPFYIMSIVIFFCPLCYHLQAIYTSKLLHYSNSLANVLIYTLRIREFKHTVLRIFCRKPDAVSLPSLPAPRNKRALDRHHGYHEYHTANEIHLMHIVDKDSSSPKDNHLEMVESPPQQLLGPKVKGMKKYFTSHSV